MLSFLNKNIKGFKPLQTFLPRAFGTDNNKDQVRIRNFFELDPLFPDLHDPDRYTPPERLPLAEAKEKMRKKKRMSVNFFSSSAKRQLTKMSKSSLEGKLSEKINGKQGGSRRQRTLAYRKKLLQDVGEAILIDADLQLPYGFGFDKTIFELREKNLSSDTDSFLQDLDRIFNKLSYANDFELVEMHKQVIVEKGKDDYKEKARAILLDHVISKIKELRQGKKDSQKDVEALFADKEFLKASLNASNLDSDFAQKAASKLSPTAVDNEARRLAEEKFDQKLAFQKEHRKNSQKELIGEGYQHLEVYDPIYESDGMGEPLHEDPVTRDQHEFLGQRQLSQDVEARGTLDEYRAFLKKNTRKGRYLATKIDYLTNYGGKQKDSETSAAGEEQVTPFKRNQGKSEVISETPLEADVKKLSKGAIESDPELRELLRQTGFSDFIQKPTFSEALMEAERALSNIPISLRSKLTGPGGEVSSNLHEIDTQGHFWGNLSKIILPTVPKTFQTQKKQQTQADIQEAVAAERKEMEKWAEEQERLKPSPYLEHHLYKLGEKKDTSQTDQDLTLNDLTQAEQHELEIFKKIRKDPFYQHHIANHLSYFVDRNQDLQAKKGGIDANDEINFEDYPILPKSFYENAEQLLSPKIYNGVAFGKGSRKTCSALAVIKKGDGKIIVNGKNLIDYFTETYLRFPIIAPLYHTAMTGHVDVRLYLWGGGISAKSQAAQLAVAKALVSLNPGFRKILKPIELLRVDHRNVEPKHTGLYKARKKYPYNRR
mmetsp:Transcript_76681/g.89097  ORF Transcript_76681/g.89097 Transcript_76681/m.89097 type:complete len:771 (+) Transcript_76681:16-2328(+)